MYSQSIIHIMKNSYLTPTLKQSGILILINAHKPLCFPDKHVGIGTERFRCKKGLTTFLGLITFIAILITGCNDEMVERFPEVEQPNIVIIYADDVGYGDVGVYGAEKIPTPHLDQMAADGIRFTSAYATAATCTPSRYSLMTGLYAFRNEDASVLPGDAPMLLEPGMVTLPSVLQAAGYRTSVVGKWHLGLGDGNMDWNEAIRPGPLEVGFDESFLLPATNDRVPTVYVEGHYVKGLSEEDDPLRVSYEGPIGDLPTGMSHPELLHYPADEQHSGTIVEGISRIGWQDGGQSAWWDDQQMALVFAERAEEFIRRTHEQGPFFLYLSMHENHVPRWPHPQFVGESEVGLRGDTVVELDWVVGQVVETVEELGLQEETLILFTSDNGPVLFDGYEDGALEENNGHDPIGPFRGGKYIAFEGGTRMPTIASWPGVIEAGLESDAIFSQVDLLATFASLAGAEIPVGVDLDSEDLLDVLLGRSFQGREHVVQQSTDGLAIRKDNWKYIEPGNRSEWAYIRHNLGDTPMNITPLTSGAYLFDLAEDPGEMTNLAEEYPEKVEELHELLQNIKSEY